MGSDNSAMYSQFLDKEPIEGMMDEIQASGMLSSKTISMIYRFYGSNDMSFDDVKNMFALFKIARDELANVPEELSNKIDLSIENSQRKLQSFLSFYPSLNEEIPDEVKRKIVALYSKSNNDPNETYIAVVSILNFYTRIIQTKTIIGKSEDPE